MGGLNYINIMNENLNLVEILKDCPKGTKLYSSVFGMVELDHINIRTNYPIVIKLKGTEGYESLTSEGKMFVDYDGECVLFPSRENRDWSEFKPKQPKFDPKTLQPFDRVLVRDNNDNSESWRCDLFSHISTGCFRFICAGNGYHYCIPYNDDTKHLVGTTDEAPEYYRYWED